MMIRSKARRMKKVCPFLARQKKNKVVLDQTKKVLKEVGETHMALHPQELLQENRK